MTLMINKVEKERNLVGSKLAYIVRKLRTHSSIGVRIWDSKKDFQKNNQNKNSNSLKSAYTGIWMYTHLEED